MIRPYNNGNVKCQGLDGNDGGPPTVDNRPFTPCWEWADYLTKENKGWFFCERHFLRYGHDLDNPETIVLGETGEYIDGDT